MLECICCQCREHSSQFNGWLQCYQCDLYGSPDEDFADDPDKQLCTECYADCQRPDRYVVEYDDLFGGYWVVDTTIEDGKPNNVFGSASKEEAEAKAAELEFLATIAKAEGK